MWAGQVVLLTEELQGMGLGGGGDVERLKAKNKELKKLLQESEDELSAANNGFSFLFSCVLLMESIELSKQLNGFFLLNSQAPGADGRGRMQRHH